MIPRLSPRATAAKRTVPVCVRQGCAASSGFRGLQHSKYEVAKSYGRTEVPRLGCISYVYAATEHYSCLAYPFDICPISLFYIELPTIPTPFQHSMARKQVPSLQLPPQPSPASSPVPPPIFMSLPTSTAAPGPSPTPLPPHHVSGNETQTGNSTPADKPSKAFPLPTLRLEIRDLSHPGSTAFLSALNAATALSAATTTVLTLLYSTPDTPHTHAPPTRSVTVIVRDMPGVAYTTGSELDADHKEIHVSASYIAGVPAGRVMSEIQGVLTHELVHCFQYNAHGTCPGGLVEGIADWVRLNAGLSPPHWKKSAEGKWDAGYQTTGYFLQYLEGRYGGGTIRRLNERLRARKYEEKAFWTEFLGAPVAQLWSDYGKSLEKETSAEKGTKEQTKQEVEKEDTANEGGNERGGL